MAPPKRSEVMLREAARLYEKFGTVRGAAEAAGVPEGTMQHRVKEARALGMIAAPDKAESSVDLAEQVRVILARRPSSTDDMARATKATRLAVTKAVADLIERGYRIECDGGVYHIPKAQEASYISGDCVEIVSRKDNTFLFGACGDQHIGSKYFRPDVLNDYYDRYEKAAVQAVFNTGNYVEGDSSFNRFDVEVHGLHSQIEHLAKTYPQKDFPTYAVWGDDHEGWWAQREGVDVGRYVEDTMRRNGRDDWRDLGFMEAHVKLVNANTGKSQIMAVVHPGGGSAYALSYSIQKIVESYEGGEKPAVGLYGHYHKMWSGIIRNVWCIQTGTAQDQTPFMRKKRLEAHVGAYLVGLEQDPRTGAIIGCQTTAWRYFNEGYYAAAGNANGRWSKHGDVRRVPRSIAA